jgi:hypothetical protein
MPNCHCEWSVGEASPRVAKCSPLAFPKGSNRKILGLIASLHSVSLSTRRYANAMTAFGSIILWSSLTACTVMASLRLHSMHRVHNRGFFSITLPFTVLGDSYFKRIRIKEKYLLSQILHPAKECNLSAKKLVLVVGNGVGSGGDGKLEFFS